MATKQDAPSQPLFQFSRFPKTFAIGLSISWDTAQINYTNQNKVRYLWAAIILGPYQISMHLPIKIYGIRGVVK